MTVGTPIEAGPIDSVRTILVNSSVAAILAAGVMVLAHELVHLVTGLALGHPGTLYAFGVDHGADASPGQVAAMAISAPIFSLLTGLVMAFWLPLRRRGGFAHLLWLWVAFTSIMEGVGYLVITPFGAGDTATFVKALDLPGWVGLAAGGVGVGLQFLTARLFAPHVGRHAGLNNGPRSGPWAFAFWPWLIASAVNTVLAVTYLSLTSALAPQAWANFGVGAMIAVVAAGMATTVFAPMAFIFNKHFHTRQEPLRLRPVPVSGLIALAVLIGVNLVLCRGLSLG